MIRQNELFPGQNTGFIPAGPGPRSWVAGLESGAAVVENNQSADWRPYLPTGEWQTDIFSQDGKNYNLDFLDCVSFSANQVLQTFGDLAFKNSLWGAETMAWLAQNGYIDSNGHLNFSDRFTAKLSNTTKNGNTLEAVWDSIRANGLVPESRWANPVAEVEANPGAYWEIYYKDVPTDVIALGKEFASRFMVAYEWLAFENRPLTDTQYSDALKIAPIQIATAVCPPWNTSDVLNGCGEGAAHATMLTYVEPGTGIKWIFDHYVPFQKRFADNYDLTYAVRGYFEPVTSSPNKETPKFSHVFGVQLTYNGANNNQDELHALQMALQTLKRPNIGSPYMKPGIFGPFGPQTRAALALFQLDYGIKDPGGAGVDFGPQTRAAMNKALAEL